jgi:Tol biopolymer transport system component
MRRALSIATALLLGTTSARAREEELPAPPRPQGSLLYLGRTPNDGWQVFHIRLDDSTIKQISTTLGDKRDPKFDAEGRRFLYKNSLGQILHVPADGGTEAELSDRISSVANFTFSRGAKTVFFTQPAAEKYRQDIWRFDLPTNTGPAIATAVPAGMLKQVSLSPDEKWLAATHIVRGNEERLVVSSVTEPGDVQHLTPEMTLSATPSWLSNSKRIVFSFGKVRGTLQIAEIDVESKEIKELTKPEGVDHLSPVSDRQDKFIFFEERAPDSSSLVYLDRASGTVTKLKLPHQSRQPFWFDHH